ncbi:MAG: molybdopterin-dependent oxidoreductase [Nitrospiraceae bacterium]|nr:molybdopterin-dependent oxidoreductase [Nitrospiraceae bacterium]
MENHREEKIYRPAALAGALTGAMLTAALMGVLYAGWKAAGLAFVPFDAFDWTARVLPGRLTEFVIGSMVALIQALHLGAISTTAKRMEQAIGIFNFLIAGVIGAAILFTVLRAIGGRLAYPLGLALGMISAVPALMISLTAGRTAKAAPAVNALWIMLTFLAWGASSAWAFRRMTLSPSGLASGGREKQGCQEQARVIRIGRRRFLVLLAGYSTLITVSGTVVGALASGLGKKGGVLRTAPGERWSAAHPLPNAGAKVLPAPGTRPEFTPLEKHYRIDIDTIPPEIDGRSWRLKIGGLVEKPLSLSLAELRRYGPMHQFITLSCISNPAGGDLISTTRWTGVSLKRLIGDWGLNPRATHLMIRSADDFYEAVALDAIRSDPRIMLTYAWDGVPLLQEHGFPLRIYIPDVYGMKQPKWIESIEAVDHWEPGYWVVRGWDEVARMKSTSVIDTVAVNSLIKSEGRTLVPVGGIAHAGARGISKVEVKVDGGPWVEAELRTPMSGLTWVIWRYNWPFQPGRHTFTVRCYDGRGIPQITAPHDPFPGGATGLNSKTRES